MDEKELLHEAMMNSFNVITEKSTVDKIEKSGFPVFVHFPERNVDKDSVKLITMYFIMEESYEKCDELKRAYQKIFNEDMPNVMCKCVKPLFYQDDKGHIVCKNCSEVLV